MKDTAVGQLMALLSDNREIPLRFYAEDISINPGYHVTEVKHASVKSMDCGKRADAWEEILIQLLDGKADSGKVLMSTSKFASIVGASLNSFSEQSTPFLFFEFSPDNGPVQKLRVKSTECNGQELSIYLTHEKATCKPFERWGKAGAEFDTLSERVTRQACCGGRSKC